MPPKNKPAESAEKTEPQALERFNVILPNGEDRTVFAKDAADKDAQVAKMIADMK